MHMLNTEKQLIYKPFTMYLIFQCVYQQHQYAFLIIKRIEQIL